MKYISLILLVLLSACGAPGTRVIHFNEEQTFSLNEGSDTRTIKWIRLNQDALQKRCATLTGIKVSGRNEFVGCYTQTANSICFVYTGVDTSHQILGHEVRHCFQGEFHK